LDEDNSIRHPEEQGGTSGMRTIEEPKRQKEQFLSTTATAHTTTLELRGSALAAESRG
jgi:hypothetical protein